jgi:competence protein ComEA
MIEWLKEHKYVGITGALIILFLTYYLYTIANPPLEEGGKEDWITTEDSESVEEAITSEEIEVEEIVVDVKGAVHNPGVYKAKTDERVMDVIDRAGGITEVADDDAINFAMRVTDEMVIYVPTAGEEVDTAEGMVSLDNGGSSGKVNINKATAAELETLPGIGPAKAEAIIEYRETNGPYKTIEDIMLISGFGEKTFEKLQESISVK